MLNNIVEHGSDVSKPAITSYSIRGTFLEEICFKLVQYLDDRPILLEKLENSI